MILCNPVEQHGKNPRQNVIAIIPARLESTRLPGKLLLELDGKPLILHTLQQATKAKNVSRVIVATDSEEIASVVKADGGEAILTATTHQSGSDRIAEVAADLEENSIIVNVQGDEPLISPAIIEKAVSAILDDASADIVTTCERIGEASDVLNPDIVKVVVDERGYALYFSRSPIPYPRDAARRAGNLENAFREDSDLSGKYFKHTGIYVYRREYLLKFAGLSQTPLEKTEMLEQLRALENGGRIKVVEVEETSIGVDTAEDFKRVEQALKARREIVYRRATADDAPAVARVHIESWRKSFAGIVPQKFLDEMSFAEREKAFRERLQASDGVYKMFVAETEHDGIVGFADFGAVRQNDFPFEAELYAIYLLKEFQNRNIGERLFKMCVREMIAGGINSMYLLALDISPYKNFYERMGGEIVGSGNHFVLLENYKTVAYAWKDLRGKDE